MIWSVLICAFVTATIAILYASALDRADRLKRAAMVVVVPRMAVNVPTAWRRRRG